MRAKKSHPLYPAWDYIQEKLEETIALNQIAFVSNLSPWHFHRIFSKLQGESVQEHIRRLRLEKAAYELKISSYPILEIAIAAGYESNEAFTKAFRRLFNETPRQFRSRIKPALSREKTAAGLDGFLKKEIAEFRILYVRRFGAYEQYPGPDPNSREVQTLLRHIAEMESEVQNHQWIGVSQDDPQITRPEKIRFDLGISLPGKISPNEFRKRSAHGRGIQTIAGGKYLVARHRGPYANLPLAYDFLLNEYAARKKLVLRNSAPFEIYLDPLGSKLKEPVTDIYVPLIR